MPTGELARSPRYDLSAGQLGRTAGDGIRQREANSGQWPMETMATDIGQWTIDSGQQTVGSGQQTADIRQHTVDSGQQAADSIEQAVDSR